MKKVKRWRYYCEFCKKSGGHRYWIERHETGCTKNPKRICGMCHLVGNEQAKIEDLTKIISDHAKIKSTESEGWISISIRDEAGLIKKLRGATGDCPACILAALRQSELQDNPVVNFNFKDERDRFFDEYNSENQDYGYY